MRVTFIGFLMIATGLASAIARADDQADQHAALMYVQSVVSPALVTVCNDIFPDGAGRLEVTLTRWLRKNRDLIAHGEQVMLSAARAEGKDLTATLASQREAISQAVRVMPSRQQLERCKMLSDILEDESR